MFKKINAKDLSLFIKITGFLLGFIPYVAMVGYAYYATTNPNISFEEFRENLFIIAHIVLFCGFIGMVVLPILGQLFYLLVHHPENNIKREKTLDGKKNIISKRRRKS